MFSLETLSISYFTSSSVQSQDIFATKAPSDYSNCLGVTWRRREWAVFLEPSKSMILPWNHANVYLLSKIYTNFFFPLNTHQILSLLSSAICTFDNYWQIPCSLRHSYSLYLSLVSYRACFSLPSISETSCRFKTFPSTHPLYTKPDISVTVAVTRLWTINTCRTVPETSLALRRMFYRLHQITGFADIGSTRCRIGATFS